MKKLSIILATLFAAGVMTSCVEPFEYDLSLALNNSVLVLPKVVNTDPATPTPYYNHTQVTSNGTWEATIETADGQTWCWLTDRYMDYKNDKEVVVKNLKIVKYFEDGVKGYKVRGNGTLFLPICYMSGGPRYAILTVRRVDTGETLTMRIDQK